MGVRRWDAVAVGSVLAALVYTGLVYQHLPDPMATHFDLWGRPNGWTSKPIASVGIPALAIVLWGVVRFAGLVLPRGDKKRLAEGPTSFVAMLTTVFLAAVHLIVVRVALVPTTPVGPWILFLVGILAIGLGLAMPRVRRNPVIGIRTPWTLTSDENWARTHRFAGYSMVLGGAVTAAAGVSGTIAGAVVAIVALLVSMLVPAVYSLVLARRQDA